MNSPSLREFVTDALEARRIRFGDLRRLQRDVLPARLATREEAEMLVDLDRSVRTADDESGKCSGSSHPVQRSAFLSAHSAVYNTFNVQRHRAAAVSRQMPPGFRRTPSTTPYLWVLQLVAFCGVTNGNARGSGFGKSLVKK